MKRFFYSFIFLLFSIHAHAQLDTITNNLPNVFVDCNYCDTRYFRQSFSHINFVRDRRMADVYMLFTNMQLANGGNQYTLFANYLNPNYLPNDTFITNVEANVSDAIIRDELIKIIKQAVLPLYAQKKYRNAISFEYNNQKKEESNTTQKDKWNYWVFNINSNLNFSQNSFFQNIDSDNNLNINRTTNANKFIIGGYYGLNYTSVEQDNAKSISRRSSIGGYSFYAASINKHFSVGYFSSFWNSTASNLLASLQLFPSIEYNLFPYDEATRRQFRVMYRNGYRYQQFYEVNYFDKIKIDQWMHSLTLSYSQIQNWGNVNVSVGTFHYFNYLKNYSIKVNPSINWNIFKGFQLGLWNSSSIIYDQFFLPKSDANLIDLSLGNSVAATNFDISGGFYINYTFGSKYSNIVNVRFNLNDDFW